MRAVPVTFHPQRLYPAYARIPVLAASLPAGLTLASRLLGTVMFNDDPADTENIDAATLTSGSFVVCAFPRSGSTFLQAALAARLDRPDVPKSHDVLAIPALSAAGARVLVPVRPPRASTASWSLYNSDQPSLALLRSRLDTYTAWHRQLERVRSLPGVQLLNFDAMTSGTDELLDRAGVPCLTLTAARPIDVDEVANQAGIAVNQRHLPCRAKQQAARHYLGLLDHPSLRRALARAQATYDHLAPAFT